MSFVLDPLEPLSEGVHRILKEQSADALKALSRKKTASGVHDARKAAKRCRALLQAVRPGFEDAIWDMERNRFRDAGRAIGATRDAEVRIQTFDLISPGERPEVRVALEAARGELEVGAIDMARARFAELPAVPLELRTRVLFDGMTRTYRRMREAAKHEDSAEAIHAFRRRVKEHLFQLQLLKPAWESVFTAMAKDADRLQEELGLWHDLAILRGWLLERGLLDEQLDARLIATMDNHLHRTAAWAPKLTAMPPRAFRAWLDHLWP